jgi:hypothetical protein
VSISPSTVLCYLVPCSIINNPKEAKYRLLKKDNKVVQAKVGFDTKVEYLLGIPLHQLSTFVHVPWSQLRLIFLVHFFVGVEFSRVFFVDS